MLLVAVLYVMVMIESVLMAGFSALPGQLKRR